MPATEYRGRYKWNPKWNASRPTAARLCEVCGGTFMARLDQLARGRARACSLPCRAALRFERMPDRFWALVKRGEGCWEWVGTIKPEGYGAFCWREKSKAPMLAHRVSYLLEHDSIPDGLHVLHRCDNRRCVRPDHLFVGTRTDNMQDAARKGRIRNQFSV